MNKKLVNATMKKMAMASPDFKQLHDFFMELSTLDKPTYVTTCRAKMAHLADVVEEKVKAHELAAQMRQVHLMDDEQVVKMSALILDCLVNAVAVALKEDSL